MKRIMVLTVIILSLVLGSCDYVTLYDITVKNTCGFTVRIGIEWYEYLEPSPYSYLDPGSSTTYKELTYGTRYLHVRDPDYSWSSVRGHSAIEMKVDRSETWEVQWDGFKYSVVTRNY